MYTWSVRMYVIWVLSQSGTSILSLIMAVTMLAAEPKPQKQTWSINVNISGAICSWNLLTTEILAAETKSQQIILEQWCYHQPAMFFLVPRLKLLPLVPSNSPTYFWMAGQNVTILDATPDINLDFFFGGGVTSWWNSR